MKSKFLLGCASVLFLTGCIPVISDQFDMDGTQINVRGTQESYYLKTAKVASDVDDVKSVITKVNNKVTESKFGIQYSQLDGDDGYYSVSLKHEDMASLKYLFSKSKGVMEPLYRVNENGYLILDKKSTASRHRFLREKVGLKLNPLRDTYKFHKVLEKMAESEFTRTISGKSYSMSEILSGKSDFYTQNYLTSLTKTFGSGYDYVVHNAGASMYSHQVYTHLVSQYGSVLEAGRQTKKHVNLFKSVSDFTEKNLNDKRTLQRVQSASLTATIIGGLEFVPTAYYQNLKSAGAVSIRSGCYYVDFEEIKNMLNANGTILGNYASAITEQFTDVTQELVQARKKLREQVKVQSKNFGKVSKACLVGLSALEVSGVIASKKLR